MVAGCEGGVQRQGGWRVGCEGRVAGGGGGREEDLLLCSWDEDDFTSSTVSTTDQQPGVSHAHDDPPLFIVVIPFTFTLAHLSGCFQRSASLATGRGVLCFQNALCSHHRN